MKMRFLALLIALTASRPVPASETDYLRDIKPILAEKCSSCHGALKQEAGLRLDAGSLILKGSQSGPVVEPGKTSESLIIDRVSDPDPENLMPPEGVGEALTPKQVELLKSWIEQGAKVPDDETIPADPSEHWAYQPPQKLDSTAEPDSERPNPIDAILHRHQKPLGIIPVKKANRMVLLRRAYFDLTGIPPSRDQIKEFANPDSKKAFEKVVDQLLESPHYGERWGRHWMDVWRYSDWDGYKNELRGSQKHIWRWRDWIVKSLNEDRPYNQMIVDMLAADEIAPTDPNRLAATGYLARNFHKSNRNIWLDATVEHSAKAFLGMTINCARCHDHKYDPISQTEYYRFRAIFEPHQVRLDRVPGQKNTQIDGLPRAFDSDPAAPTYLLVNGDEKQPKKDLSILPGTPAILRGRFQPNPIQLSPSARYPAIRDFEIAETRAELQQKVTMARGKANLPADSPESGFAQRQLELAQVSLKSFERTVIAEKAKQVPGNLASTIQRASQQAASAQRQRDLLRARLEHDLKNDQFEKLKSGSEEERKKNSAAIAKKEKELAQSRKKLDLAIKESKKETAQFLPLGKEYAKTSSGRRLALAHWIADRNNPLTARVAVNHIWLRHFGSPLVDNVFDFGLRSPQPVHAELLDWLAVEFMENRWSMKHIHRLILTSRTWQRASDSDSKIADRNRTKDPNNVYLWRMNPRRLDAELIRDHVLAVAGQLDATIGGPEIDFRKGEQSRRRSIYLRHAYEKQMTMLLLFDTANPNECYRRSKSIVPQQALALANSQLCLEQSRILAGKLWTELEPLAQPRDPVFVENAYLQMLGRPPSDAEAKICIDFLQRQADLLSRKDLSQNKKGLPPKIKPADDPAGRARENLVHVLMNHNDFVTVR